MKKVCLRYGRTTIPVAIPEWVKARIIRKPTTSAIERPQEAVVNCFEEPIGCPSLRELASGSESVCIAICDITRPVPNNIFLRPMLEILLDAGIDAGKITILVATGLHRPNDGEELQELIGDPWVLDKVRIVNHNAKDDACNKLIGYTERRGTPVRLNQAFIDADLRIVTGLVEPHFMAGYSGGRKVIAPGLAHSETIRTFHSGRFMADPAASNCNFANNPLHEEQLEIVRMLGAVYAVNTVIDEGRNLQRINFGEVTLSHAAMVEQTRSDCEVFLNRRYRTVVTSAAGYPLDQTYYQTIKGMVGALGILEEGGDLIIVSACNQGLGSEEFRNSQKRLVEMGRDAFLNSLMEKPLADIDEWQSQKQADSTGHVNVILYTEGLSEEEQFLTGVNCVGNLQDAVNASIAGSSTPSIAVIPEGPYVIPFYRN